MLTACPCYPQPLNFTALSLLSFLVLTHHRSPLCSATRPWVWVHPVQDRHKLLGYRFTVEPRFLLEHELDKA